MGRRGLSNLCPTTEVGATCLPVLETWDTNTARGGVAGGSPLASHRSGCPTLATSLFLSLGRESTKPHRGICFLSAAESKDLRLLLFLLFTTRTHHKSGCPMSPGFGDMGYHHRARRDGGGSPFASPQKRVPHPRDPFVFVARVGSHETQLENRFFPRIDPAVGELGPPTSTAFPGDSKFRRCTTSRQYRDWTAP